MSRSLGFCYTCSWFEIRLFKSNVDCLMVSSTFARNSDTTSSFHSRFSIPLCSIWSVSWTVCISFLIVVRSCFTSLTSCEIAPVYFSYNCRWKSSSLFKESISCFWYEMMLFKWETTGRIWSRIFCCAAWDNGGSTPKVPSGSLLSGSDTGILSYYLLVIKYPECNFQIFSMNLGVVPMISQFGTFQACRLYDFSLFLHVNLIAIHSVIFY